MSDGVHPGRGWRVIRRLTQALAIVAVLVAPFLGGWQRLERNDLSSWSSAGADLPLLLRDRLPRGDAAGDAYDANQILGGGIGVRYLDVPTIDPLAGALTLLAGPPTLKAIFALALPVLIAVVAGRVFCGWFCPFGTLSRGLAWGLDFVPWRPRYRFPRRRPVRFLVLGLGLLAGLLGSHVVLYLLLPHLLLQQTVYATWLLGGGGAALGLLAGLLLAGLVLGPTAYCATLCPTGAALRLLGHKKVVHLKIAAPSSCPTTCRRCSLSCWIQLDPASGDPGPDCDACGRCVPQCPKTNLRVGLGRGTLKAGLLLAAALTLAPSAVEGQGRVALQPRLALAAERSVDGVTIAVDVVDQTGVRLGADSEEALYGCDVSVFLARGARPPPVDRGMPRSRDAYDGPLTVRLHHEGGVETLRYESANHPRSTPRRTIFRSRVPVRLRAGDAVVVDPVPGWTRAPQRFDVPEPGVRSGPLHVLAFLVVGALLFAGLLALALGMRDPAPGRA